MSGNVWSSASQPEASQEEVNIQQTPRHTTTPTPPLLHYRHSPIQHPSIYRAPLFFRGIARGQCLELWL